MDDAKILLRHSLAVIAYRGSKALRDAPVDFADFQPGFGLRTPVVLLAHIGDLFDWALTHAEGTPKWNVASPLPWAQEVERFHESLKRLDDFLASNTGVAADAKRLLQGPIADALTHVGQLVMYRRMHGSGIKSENFFVAGIETGRVGPDQTPPKREF